MVQHIFSQTEVKLLKLAMINIKNSSVTKNTLK